MRNRYLSVLLLSVCLIGVINIVFAHWDEFHLLNQTKQKVEQTLSIKSVKTPTAKTTLANPADKPESKVATHKALFLNQQQFVGLYYDLPLTEKEKAKQVLQDAWQGFVSHPSRLSIQHRQTDDIYFIYSDYSRYASGSISLFVGYKVKDLEKIPTQFKTITVPAQHYAEFSVQGDLLKEMPKLWQKLPDLKLNRRFGYDIEVYPSSNVLDHTGDARLLISTNDKEK
ncbi:GyrI-like domain-containing protein [Vibrio sp. SCSIO 43137]|uniref:GyrI-like domain-containing protein n=1 Tax=Vibrio sp. SCSIO 43137 TaxID=3021011 RepID=UPI002307D31A|nr:effector binding domain-containing protein [Vibrio sp. SCSIO 43137]WCE32597.1 effector binding domain-containing protein [Vibrio sp. SCSIO 43137]